MENQTTENLPKILENRHSQTSVVGVYTGTIFIEGQFIAPRKITNTYALWPRNSSAMNFSNLHLLLPQSTFVYVSPLPRWRRLLNKWASLIAQLVKNLPAMQQTPVQFLGWKDPLEKGLAIHYSILELPLWLSWWRIHLQCRRPEFDWWVGKIPWRRERLPTPVFWPGELASFP